MTLSECLHQARQKIAAALSTSALLDAEILLAYVLDKPRTYLRAWPEASLTPTQAHRFAECVKRRCDREPIAYITGSREFWSLEMRVGPATLIPRPETELIVETALTLLGSEPHCKLADLGTGSGAIALALAHERPGWQIEATDCSVSALRVASQNAQRLALGNISFYCGDWCTALPSRGIDAIVSNPPYLTETEWEAYAHELHYEPRHALVSGQQGLEAILTIIQSAIHYLRQNGYLLIEHGYAQGACVRKALTAVGYHRIYTINDLAGKERVTVGRSPDGNT